MKCDDEPWKKKMDMDAELEGGDMEGEADVPELDEEEVLSKICNVKIQAVLDKI